MQHMGTDEDTCCRGTWLSATFLLTRPRGFEISHRRWSFLERGLLSKNVSSFLLYFSCLALVQLRLSSLHFFSTLALAFCCNNKPLSWPSLRSLHSGISHVCISWPLKTGNSFRTCASNPRQKIHTSCFITPCAIWWRDWLSTCCLLFWNFRALICFGKANTTVQRQFDFSFWGVVRSL